GLARPAGPIPAEATAVHGIDDAAVRGAPTFAELAPELRALLEGAVFVAHNADFDLPLVQHAFARAGARYLPTGVACTLDAFRLLEPTERRHRLQAGGAARRLASGATGSSRCASGTESSSTTRTTPATTRSPPSSCCGSCSGRGLPPRPS